MAFSFSLPVIYLALACGNGLVTVHGSEQYAAEPSSGPHFTRCVSREQATFRCWWTAGSFQNLTDPGALGVFFQTPHQSKKWKECPEYTSTVENECYFNQTFTTVWRSYCIQLRSMLQNHTYDERCFSVENIVHPDPPVALNWTLLNVSRSGLHYDILVRWASPPSADAEHGWMNLEYQVVYQVKNASDWKELDPAKGTQNTVYGLLTGKEYEVKVRSRMVAFKNFGDFTDSVIVHVAQIPIKESTFPTSLVLIFGVIGVVILLVLLIFSQQQRLMVIFLPPIPAPKIKGIDPELLKNGKLDQLNSLLSSHDLYKPDIYHEDPWVEFIQLDLDDPAEKNHNSDTQHLLGMSNSDSCGVLNFKTDEDSGRASCYDPEMAESEDLLTASLLPGHSAQELRHPLVSGSSSSSPNLGVPQTSGGVETPVQTQPAVSRWVNMDFYAQVSDFTPAGEVVLSPGQMNTTPVKKKEEEQDKEDEKKIQFQLLADGAYACEIPARQIVPDVTSGPNPEHGYQAFPTPSLGFHGEYLASPSDSQRPDVPLTPVLPPLSDYTVVQDVDAQHSLLLNPSSSQPIALPHSPSKQLAALPAMTMGYLTPDLLGNLIP